MFKQEAEAMQARLLTEIPWLQLVEARNTGTYWYVYAYDPRLDQEREFVSERDVKDYVAAMHKRQGVVFHLPEDTQTVIDRGLVCGFLSAIVFYPDLRDSVEQIKREGQMVVASIERHAATRSMAACNERDVFGKLLGDAFVRGYQFTSALLETHPEMAQAMHATFVSLEIKHQLHLGMEYVAYYKTTGALQ